MSVTFELLGLSLSLQCTVSVDSSFTVRLGRPFLHIITRRGSVIRRATRTIIEKKRRFPHDLGWGVRHLSTNARPPNVRTADPTCTTHFRSDGLVCRSRWGKVDRHHHYVHTRHLALPLVSLPPFFALGCQTTLQVSDERELYIPVCVVPKPSMRNLFGPQEVQGRPSAPHLIK